MTPEERNRLAEQWLETALKPRIPEPRPGLESRIVAAIEAEKRASRSPSPFPRFAFRVPRFVCSIAAGLVLASGLALYWSYRQQIRGADGTIESRTVPVPARTGASKAVQQSKDIPTLRSAQDGAPRPGNAGQPLQTASMKASTKVAVQPLREDPKSGAILPSRAEAAAHERAVQKRSTLVQRESPRLEQFPAPRPLSEQERLLLVYLRTTPKEEIFLVAQRQTNDDQRRRKQFATDSVFPASGAAAPDGITEEK